MLSGPWRKCDQSSISAGQGLGVRFHPSPARTHSTPPGARTRITSAIGTKPASSATSRFTRFSA